MPPFWSRRARVSPEDPHNNATIAPQVRSQDTRQSRWNIAQLFRSGNVNDTTAIAPQVTPQDTRPSRWNILERFRRRNANSIGANTNRQSTAAPQVNPFTDAVVMGPGALDPNSGTPIANTRVQGSRASSDDDNLAPSPQPPALEVSSLVNEAKAKETRSQRIQKLIGDTSFFSPRGSHSASQNSPSAKYQKSFSPVWGEHLQSLQPQNLQLENDLQQLASSSREEYQQKMQQILRDLEPSLEPSTVISDLEAKRGYLDKYLESDSNFWVPLPEDGKSKKAIDTAGMPRTLARIILSINNSFGSTTIIRFGTRPHSDVDMMTKSTRFHSKACNHGLLYGFLADDHANLSRINAQRTLDTINAAKLHQEDIKKNERLVAAVPLKRTLRQILRSVYIPGVNEDERADMEIVNIQDGNLVLKYRQNQGPENFQGEFLVKLSELNTIDNYTPPYYDPLGDPLKEKDERITNFLSNGCDGISLSTSTEANFFDPSLLEQLKALASNENDLDKELFIDYKTKPEEGFQPLKVLAMNNIPITGDWDIEISTCPERIPDKYRTVYTAESPADNTATLMRTTKVLFDDYIKRPGSSTNPEELIFTALKKVFEGIDPNRDFSENPIQLDELFIGGTPEELAKNSGVITPFEFFQNIATNFLCAVDKYGPDYKKAITLPYQHGGEHRSPVTDAAVKPDEGGVRLAMVPSYDGQESKCCITQGQKDISKILAVAINHDQVVDIAKGAQSIDYKTIAVVQGSTEKGYINPALLTTEGSKTWETWVTEVDKPSNNAIKQELESLVLNRTTSSPSSKIKMTV